jgi:branched-chain amino acid transport system ATP-binding protein
VHPMLAMGFDSATAAATTAAATAVQATAIRKRYGGVVALDGVDLAIRKGEVFGIIGPNGAGKSTLFDILCGIVQPTSGEVRLFGQAIAGLRSHEVARRGVARSFQRTAVFPDATVLENLLFARHTRSQGSVLGRILHSPAWKRDRELFEQKAHEILALTGLMADRDRPASVLAYGVQRRLAVGVALMTEPQLLFLDEPAAGMNDSEGAEFVELVRAVSRGLTVVIVEHDMTVIRALCDRCLAMADGTPMALGTPAEVLRHPQVVEAYLGAADE